MNTLRRLPALVALLVLSNGFLADALAQVSSQYASGWIASPTTGPTPGVDWFPLPPSPNPIGPPNSNCVGTTNAPTVWAQFSYASFGLPGGATIEGIEVNVNYGSVVAPDMQLYLSGSPVGSTRTLPSTPSTGSCNASVLRTAGGPMDLWGTSLTAADFNSGNLEVRLTRTTAGPDNPVSIDIESIQLVVYYDDGSNNDPDCSGGAIATQNANAACQATISGADVTGVTDPDGDPLTITVSPMTLVLGANSVTINADDGNGGTCSKMVTVNVVDVTDPVITCPAHATLDADANTCSASYTGPPATATDNCGATVSSTPGLPALFSGLGNNVIAYTATDAAGNSASCNQTVTVEDNTPPTITCPADVTLSADAVCQASYAGPPATATDACDASPSVGSNPVLPALFSGVGDNPIDYSATDASGNTSMCTQTVTLEDNTPPTITLVDGPIELWPPNHKYHTIDLDDLITDVADNCDAPTAGDVVTAEVSSDEPENGAGDGNTTDDIVLAGDCRAVDLRAERQGGGNGRVYTLSLEAADLSMNVGTASFEVHVPHSKKSGALDDGAAYSVPGCALPMARTGFTESLAADVLPEMAPATEGQSIPAAFVLEPNYPNPFNPSTEIRFGLPEATTVRLVIYNMVGQEVARLVDQPLPAGTHAVQWDASGLPSGAYLYRLTAGSFTDVRQMVLLK